MIVRRRVYSLQVFTFSKSFYAVAGIGKSRSYRYLTSRRISTSSSAKLTRRNPSDASGVSSRQSKNLFNFSSVFSSTLMFHLSTFQSSQADMLVMRDQQSLQASLNSSRSYMLWLQVRSFSIGSVIRPLSPFVQFRAPAIGDMFFVIGEFSSEVLISSRPSLRIWLTFFRSFL